MRLYGIIITKHKEIADSVARWIEKRFKSANEIHILTMEKIDDMDKFIDMVEGLRTASGNNVILIMGELSFEQLVRIFNYINAGVGIHLRVSVYQIVKEELEGDTNRIKLYHIDSFWTRLVFPTIIKEGSA